MLTVAPTPHCLPKTPPNIAKSYTVRDMFRDGSMEFCHSQVQVRRK